MQRDDGVEDRLASRTASGDVASDAVSRLRAALATGDAPRLRLALLFGSSARGTPRPDSDLDVAIVPADGDLKLSRLRDFVQLARSRRPPWQELPDGLDALERCAAAVARWLPPVPADDESP